MSDLSDQSTWRGDAERGARGAGDRTGVNGETVPTSVAETVLGRANYRCQGCGARDIRRDGPVKLVVHHREDDPAHCEYHDPQNLTAFCPHCYRWHHRQPDPDELGEGLKSRLADADLEPTWIEILRFLTRHGPATSGTIQEHVDLDSRNGVRQALYGLMGVDQRDPDITGRLVAKDAVTGEYGLPWQIPDDHDARGAVPVPLDERRTRILDEFVRRLYEALPEDVSDEQAIVGEVVDRGPHQTSIMRRRALAFQFPFDDWFSKGATELDGGGAIAALETLSEAADGTAPELLTGVVTEALESTGEDELAASLHDWVEAGHHQARIDAAGDSPSRETSVPRDRVEAPDRRADGDHSPSPRGGDRS